MRHYIKPQTTETEFVMTNALLAGSSRVTPSTIGTLDEGYTLGDVVII